MKIQFFYLGIFFLILSKVLYAESDRPKFTAVGTAEYFESRFVKENQKSKTNVFLNTEYKQTQIGIERRGEKELASIEFKNEFFYISGGNRYKPIPGFYILKDEKFYSAFQNPKHGIIPQPLNRSYWFGLFPSKWSAGIFYGQDISEKKPSIYIKSPLDIFAYTYSPESKVHFLAVSVRNYKISSKYDGLYSVNSQILGKRENNFGYINLKAIHPKKGVETRLSAYKEDNGQLFVTNQDNLRGTENEKAFFFKISRFHYDRIEAFQNLTEKKKEHILGVNSSLINGKKGAICISGRSYLTEMYEAKKDTLYASTVAFGISYEYRLKDTEFLFRLEKRRNNDELAELKFTIRPNSDWKFEISSLLQKNSNQFRSLFEQWSDGENINTILTDRAAAFKLKIIGDFIVFNVSGSRRINGAGEIYFANVQFKQEF